MNKFKDIYNKRRTHIIGEYQIDGSGDYVCVANDGCTDDVRYINRNNITDNDYILVSNGSYWNNTITRHANMEYKNVKIMLFKQIAEQDRNKRDTCIVGTALAFTATLWEFMICNSKIWNWFVGIVTDGYAMVGFSPFILAYWALLIVAYLPMIIILSALVLFAVVWTPIFEIPAGYMNKEI